MDVHTHQRPGVADGRQNRHQQIIRLAAHKNENHHREKKLDAHCADGDDLHLLQPAVDKIRNERIDAGIQQIKCVKPEIAPVIVHQAAQPVQHGKRHRRKHKLCQRHRREQTGNKRLVVPPQRDGRRGVQQKAKVQKKLEIDHQRHGHAQRAVSLHAQDPRQVRHGQEAEEIRREL